MKKLTTASIKRICQFHGAVADWAMVNNAMRELGENFP